MTTATPATTWGAATRVVVRWRGGEKHRNHHLATSQPHHPTLLPSRYPLIGTLRAGQPLREGYAMSRSYRAIAALYVVVIAGFLLAGADNPPTAPAPRAVPEVPPDKDITAEVKEW